jgi:periplasmic protein TonB
MKKLLLIFCLSGTTVFAQEIITINIEQIEVPPAPNFNKTSPDSLEIIDFPDEQAEYPGGMEAFNKFILSNLQLADSILQEGPFSKVYARFTVECDGSISNVEILRGVHPAIDREVKQVLRAMPAWKPAKLNGKKVRSRFTVPIRVELK